MARARIFTEDQVAAHQAKLGKGIKYLAARPVEPIAKKKRPKYGNVPVVVDGVRFPSKREAKRYRELGLLMKAGDIHFLARQVRFLLPGGVEYIADFVYGKRGYGKSAFWDTLVYEDAKGVSTKEFKIKKKLMLSEYGIDVQEV